MSDIFSTVVATSLRWLPVFAAALLLMRFMRGGPAAHRHVVCLVSLLGLATMPLLTPLLPVVRLDGGVFARAIPDAGSPRPDVLAPGATTLAPPSVAAPIDAADDATDPNASSGTRGVLSRASEMNVLFSWIWALIALVFVAREALALWRTSQAVRSAAGNPPGSTPAHGPPAPHVRGVRVSSARVEVPLACGIVRPTILLPYDWPTWPAGWIRAAVLHESHHVRRWDVLTQLIGRLICAVFWFQPAAWLALRRMQSEAELAADEAVVSSGFDRHLYGEALLGLARLSGRRMVLSGVGMAGAHPLAARLHRIVTAPAALPRRRHRLVLSVALLLALTTAVAMPARGAGGTWLDRSVRADGAVVWRSDCARETSTTVCERFDSVASEVLGASGSSGLVAIVDVRSGELRHYHFLDAAGTSAAVPAIDAGAFRMLPLAAVWWETGMGDRPQPCPAVINLAGAGAFANRNGLDTGVVRAPVDVIALRCATGAIAMGWYLAEELGPTALGEAFGRNGFGRAETDRDAWTDLVPRPQSPEIGDDHDPRTTWILAGSEHGTGRTSPLHLLRFLQSVAGGGVAMEMVPPGRQPSSRRHALFSKETADRLLSALPASGAGDGRLLGLSSGSLHGLRHQQADLFAALSLGSTGEPELAIVVWLERPATAVGMPSAEYAARQLLQAIPR